MSKRALLASVLALMRPINAVWADGRTVAYLQGVAFGIAANCPNLPLDVKAISFAKKGSKAFNKVMRKILPRVRFSFIACSMENVQMANAEMLDRAPVKTCATFVQAPVTS